MIKKNEHFTNSVDPDETPHNVDKRICDICNVKLILVMVDNTESYTNQDILYFVAKP